MKADTLQLAITEQRAPWTDIEIDTREFTVFRDKYPVTEGHLLIVPLLRNVLRRIVYLFSCIQQMC